MAKDFPDLPPQTIDVLRDIYQNGIVRGAELQHHIKLDSGDLQTAVQQLLGSAIVSVSGSVSHPDEALRAFFSIRPSAMALVTNLLGKS